MDVNSCQTVEKDRNSSRSHCPDRIDTVVPGIMVTSRVNVIVIVGWGVGIILTSNPFSRERIEPSGFVTTIFQIPFDPVGIVNQQVTCVALSHRTFLALISVIEPVLFVILAVKPCWKPEPVIVIGTSDPTVKVGLMLVMPSPVEDVVAEVSTGVWIENMLA